jgi:hypothetical protein
MQSMPCGRRFRDQTLLLVAKFTIALSLGGCSQRPTAEQSLEKAFLDAKQARQTVFPLAGRVAIDGQEPHFDKPAYKLIVMLNDPQHPDTPIRERPFAVADSHGRFAFETYFEGDGVSPGNFIVTFAVLRRRSRKGFVSPDQLHNLYNDPDQNSKNPDFVIAHQAPGKTNYTFNLEVAGKEPATAQPRALTEIVW